MSNRKEHHFVPRFYLKQFSENRKSINLFNIQHGKLIRRASIKGQCAHPHFYGPDSKIEDALGLVENKVSGIIRKIFEKERLPLTDAVDMIDLLGFVGLQRGRGQAAAQTNDEQSDALAKLWVQDAPEFADYDMDEISFENEYPALLPLKTTGDLIHYVISMGSHLFINDTPLELITSDNPVIAHNQFCEGIDYRGTLGWNSKGIQVFMPLSPRVLLLLYDSDVYSVGKTKKETVTHLSSEVEIHNFNVFQTLNAQHNLYLRSPCQEKYVRHRLINWFSKRPEKRTCVVHSERVVVDGEESAIMHTYEPLLPAKLEINAIKVRRQQRRIPLHSRSGLHRFIKEGYDDDWPGYGVESIRYPVKET